MISINLSNVITVYLAFKYSCLFVLFPLHSKKNMYYMGKKHTLMKDSTLLKQGVLNSFRFPLYYHLMLPV